MRAPLFLVTVVSLLALGLAHAQPPEPLTDIRAPKVTLSASPGWQLAAVAMMDVVGDVPVLVVEGDVINAGEKERATPRIHLQLRRQDGSEIFKWSVVPKEPKIKPRDWVAFEARLERPPADMHIVQISAVDGD